MITFISLLYKPPSNGQRFGVLSWTLAGIPAVVFNGGFDMGVTPVHDVKTASCLGFNEDVPLVNDLVLKSLNLITTPWVALINSDIIIQRDFLQQLSNIEKKHGGDIFLSCYRQDINISPLPNSLDEIFQKPYKTHQSRSGDIFISSKQRISDMATHMPDFIYGRMVWDNWIHLYFQNNGTPCFNASNVLRLRHIEHIRDEKNWPPPSVIHNYKLMGNNINKIIGIDKWPEP